MPETTHHVAGPASSLVRRLRAQVLTLLLCQAAAVAFFHEVLFTQTRSFLVKWDATALTYAWMNKAVAMWREGALPLWDFGVHGGTSLLGELSTAALYPVTAAAALFVEPGGFLWIEWWIVLHYGLALYGMLTYLRTLGVGWTGAIAGAVLFALVGSVAARAKGQAYIFAGLTYLPLVLACLHKAVRWAGPMARNPWAVGGGVLLGCSLLAGHLQPYAHIAFLAGTYAVILCVGSGGADWRRTLTALGVIGLVSALIVGVQLVPTLTYLERSYRWFGDQFMPGMGVTPFEHYAFDMELRLGDFATLLTGEIARDNGSLYVTWLGLGLALAGVLARRRYTWWALGVAVFAVLTAMGGHNPLGALIYHVPLLNKVRQPIRLLFLYDFAMAVLAAFGLHWILEELRRRLHRGVHFASIVGAVALAWLLVAAWEHREVYVPTRAEGRHPERYYERTPLVETLLKRRGEEPRLHRVVVVPKDVLPPNMGNVWPVLSTAGHRATMQQNYYDYLARDWSLGSRNLDRLAVRDVVTNAPVEPAEGLRLIIQEGEMRLYQRPDALPLFWFATAPDASDFGATAAEIEDVRWEPNAVTVTLASGQDGLLVFAQPMYPGWSATVDGQPRALDQVDIFPAASLESGERTVRFSYKEPYFGWLLFSFGAGVLWLAASLALSARERKNARTVND